MAVILCFLICWTPYHIQRIMFVVVNMKSGWEQFHSLHETLHVVSGCCYFLSAVVNPFLYSLLSKRFRRGFHDLVRNTKIWFRNFPIVVRISMRQTSGGTKESDKR